MNDAITVTKTNFGSIIGKIYKNVSKIRKKNTRQSRYDINIAGK